MVYLHLNSGIFTGQEQNADFYSDRDKKVAYLQKVIKLVELMNGEAVEAKPQKIVAGLEPEVARYLFSSRTLSCRIFISAQLQENHQSRMLIKYLARRVSLRRRR